MNLPALAIMAAIFLGALTAPAFLGWSIFCLKRPPQRIKGLAMLIPGLIGAVGIVVAGYLTAPADAPGFFRIQALVIVAGTFSISSVAGLALHAALTRGFKRPKAELQRNA